MASSCLGCRTLLCTCDQLLRPNWFLRNPSKKPGNGSTCAYKEAKRKHLRGERAKLGFSASLKTNPIKEAYCKMHNSLSKQGPAGALEIISAVLTVQQQRRRHLFQGAFALLLRARVRQGRAQSLVSIYELEHGSNL